MVRIAASISLILSGCVAEDVYYHTQLLQTKMNSNKVSIDTAGNVEEETTLFQKAMRQTSSKKAEGAARLLKRLSNGFKVMKPEMGEKMMKPEKGEKMMKPEKGEKGDKPRREDDKGERGEEDGDEAEAIVGMCKLLYGPEADAKTCFECSTTCQEKAKLAMKEIKSGEQEDYMKAWMDTVKSCGDACMDPLVNLADEACKGYYGENVDLAACQMCGLKCGCGMDGDCEDCDHGQCMADMAGGDQDDEDEKDEKELIEGCMMAYGNDVDLEKCAGCAKKVEEHFDGDNKFEDTDPDTMVRKFLGVADECMGYTNQITLKCEGIYGEEVDMFDCMMCGEYCQCDMEKCEKDEGLEEGEMPCHPGCMASDEKAPKQEDRGEPEKNDEKEPRGPKPPRDDGKKPRREKPEGRYAKLVAYVQKRQMEVEKMPNDATDLMQTHQHLKK